jgi:hypothetical protein
MSVKNEYLSPCGMYCGVCSILAAYKNNDQNLKQMLSDYFKTEPENIICEGCNSQKTFGLVVSNCSIKKCAEEKKIDGCHQCEDFICKNIDEFPIQPARKEMIESISLRKQLGTEEWVEQVERHYSCPSCGSKLHRLATICGKCNTPITFESL